MVIGVLTPPDLFLVMLISAFNLFYLLETQGIFMEIARGKWFVYDTSRAHRVQIESSHPKFSNYSRFQFLLPSLLYYFYLLETLEPCLVAWWLWSMDISRCAPQILESLTLPNIPEIACSTESK